MHVNEAASGKEGARASRDTEPRGIRKGTSPTQGELGQSMVWRAVMIKCEIQLEWSTITRRFLVDAEGIDGRFSMDC